MDPLSDVLALLKPKSYIVGGFDIGGPWSLRFGAYEGIKCYVVLSGHCWLALEGVAEAPIEMQAGDCFLLPRGTPFRLANDLTLAPIEVHTYASSQRNGVIGRHNGGGDCMVAGGNFVFSGRPASFLLGVLPPVVHLRKESDRVKMRWCMEQIRQELSDPQPGGVLIAQQLVYTMLITALRLHLADVSAHRADWLSALADKQMREAISCMHEAPAHPWTLAALADRVHMSRTAFAVKFKATVGTSPIGYLTHWRMLLAADLLAQPDTPISRVALAVGYQSESAFSTAFKRVMGYAPRRYGAGAG